MIRYFDSDSPNNAAQNPGIAADSGSLYGLIASKTWANFLSFFGSFGPIGPFGPYNDNLEWARALHGPAWQIRRRTCP